MTSCIRSQWRSRTDRTRGPSPRRSAGYSGANDADRSRVGGHPAAHLQSCYLRALRLFEERIRNDKRDFETLAPVAVQALQTAFVERMHILGDQPNAFELAQAMIEGRVSGTTEHRDLAHAGTETTTISVVDADGNAVAMIISIFADFGSGIVTDDGILLNNRLSGFFLDEKHPNGLQPGKRAMHTLHSVLVEGEDGLLLAGGTPGGHAQPQVNLQVLSRVLFRDQTLGDAAAAPRWMLVPQIHPDGSQPTAKPLVQTEPDLPTETRRALEIRRLRAACNDARGHRQRKMGDAGKHRKSYRGMRHAAQRSRCRPVDWMWLPIAAANCATIRGHAKRDRTIARIEQVRLADKTSGIEIGRAPERSHTHRERAQRMATR